MKKRLLSLVLAAACVFSMSTAVLAAEGAETITATLDRGIKVTYNGEKQIFTDVNGKIVYPIVYEGTTYLPIRAMSALVDLPVAWDGENYSVVLGGEGDAEGKKDPVGTPDTINVTINPVLDSNIKVIYNGATMTFTDVNGKTVYPIVYEGTTYLPIRAVSGLVDIPVEWDGVNYTVVLGTDPTFAEGKWTDNVYTNGKYNIKYTKDTNFNTWTDSQIESELGKQESIDYLFVVSNPLGTSNIAVMTADVGTVEGVTDEQLLDEFLKTFMSTLQTNGSVINSSDKTATLTGCTYRVLETTNNLIPQNYYIRYVDGSIVVVLITCADANDIPVYVANFNK